MKVGWKRFALDREIWGTNTEEARTRNGAVVPESSSSSSIGVSSSSGGSSSIG